MEELKEESSSTTNTTTTTTTNVFKFHIPLYAFMVYSQFYNISCL